MKGLFKKFVAAVAASCMCVTAIPFGNISVLADNTDVSPYDGDVNGDGSVGMNDVVVLNKYINGQCQLNDCTPADVNCNLVIDIVDSQILLAYIVESLDVERLPYCSTPLYSTLTTKSMDAGRQYVKHVCETGTNSVYSLLGAEVDTYAMPRIGTVDDRVWDDDKAVVQISTGGTGFIIGENLVATAAHCLYDTDSRSFCSNIEVIIRGEQEGTVSEYIRSYDAVEVHIPRKFYSVVENDTENYMMYDYALIYVDAVNEETEEEKKGLLQYGSFGLALTSDALHSSGAAVTVSGFPDSADLEGTSYGARLKETGNIVNILDNPALSYAYTHQIQFSPYFSGGQSGGPIYMTTTFQGTTYRTVVGIATSGNASETTPDYSYYGTRMTSDLLRFYLDNDNIGSTAS